MTLLFAREAYAHAVGLSKGDYVASGADVVAELTLARPELASAVDNLDANDDGVVDEAELARRRAEIEAFVVAGVSIQGDGAPCPGSLEAVSLTDQDGVLVRARFRCASVASDLSVRLTLLGALPFGHRHIAHAALLAASNDDVLYRGHEEIAVHGAALGQSSAPSANGLGFFSFLRMGIEHILTGYDHLVFLFGVILVGGRLRALVAVITAFTVAHSMTLALAVLDVWTPPSRVIEAGIALSIVYVGVENFFVANAEKRWRITFPFGLIHGFGFSSVLREISLSRAQVPVALVSFNLGVEVGQLAVMAAILPLVLWARKKKWLGRRETLVLSGCVACAGAVWFVLRAI